MIKFLLILVSIFFFFRYVIPIIFTITIKSFINKNTAVNNEDKDKEVKWGNVKVKYKEKNNQQQHRNNSDQEYVDFEEIK